MVSTPLATRTPCPAPEAVAPEPELYDPEVAPTVLIVPNVAFAGLQPPPPVRGTPEPAPEAARASGPSRTPEPATEPLGPGEPPSSVAPRAQDTQEVRPPEPATHEPFEDAPTTRMELSPPVPAAAPTLAPPEDEAPEDEEGEEGPTEVKLFPALIEPPPPAPAPDLSRWYDIMDRKQHPEGEVTIGVVGKYVSLPDAYKSLNEALVHGGLAHRVKVNIRWLDAEMFERDEDLATNLEPLHGILVPGGFGERGSEGKISSVRFARERSVPFFGICLGMQMACIEAARNTSGIADASSTEFGKTDEPVVGLITEWMSAEGLQKRGANTDMGGTMRLGAYEAKLSPNSHVAAVYGANDISERHRHRYEVNGAYRDRLEKGGLVFSGMSPDGMLPEIVERPDHPWFIGVQFHPELKSKPFDPHPLFAGFIEAAVKQSRLV